MRIHLIVNPAAGNRYRNGSATHHLRRFFERRGASVDISLTSRPSEATTIARAKSAERYDAIVACGGDGTLREVINGMVHSGVALGIIPMGTGNVIAKELGIPLLMRQAAATILNGRVERIDVGKAGDMYFVLAAGVGYDGEVVMRVRRDMKSLFGRLAYVLTGFQLIWRSRPHEYRLEFGGKSEMVRSLGIMICNASNYGGKLFHLTPDISIKDGMLDVCVFKGRGALDIIKIFSLVLMQSRVPDHHLYTFKAKKLTLYSARRTYVHNDGDFLGYFRLSPLEFEVIEKGLSVIVPKEWLTPTDRLIRLLKRQPKEAARKT